MLPIDSAADCPTIIPMDTMPASQGSCEVLPTSRKVLSMRRHMLAGVFAQCEVSNHMCAVALLLYTYRVNTDSAHAFRTPNI
jgi:hypothetical protein